MKTQKKTKQNIGFHNTNPKLLQIQNVPGLNSPKIDAKISIDNLDTKNYYCSGKITTNQSISNMNIAFLNFNTFDTNNSGMSNTNGQITIAKNGIYLINISTQWTPSSGGNPIRKSILLINGNQVAFVNNYQNTDFVNTLSYVANLNANDTIKIQVYQDSGSSINVLKDYTYLQVCMI